MDWHSLFGFSVPPAELLIRGTVMYFFLWTLFRVVIKRRVGSIGMGDLLVLVIIADAAQNGMAGEYTSISDAMVLVGTIVGWNHFIDWLGFRVPWMQRLLEPPPLLVIHRGRLLPRNMREEFLTREELEAKLRENGVKRVEDVERAYVEPDGHISVIKKGD